MTCRKALHTAIAARPQEYPSVATTLADRRSSGLPARAAKPPATHLEDPANASQPTQKIDPLDGRTEGGDQLRRKLYGGEVP